MSSNWGGSGDSGEVLFGSLARVKGKLGVLALRRDGRLIFLNRGGILFDWPVAEVSKVGTPWYLVGGGFRCEVGGSRYYATFNKLGSTARTGLLALGAGAAGAAGLAEAVPLTRAVTGVMDIAAACNLCSQWKAVIAAAQEQSPRAE